MVKNSILTNEEIRLLEKIGLAYDFSKKLSGDENINVEETVGDYLISCLDDYGEIVNPEAEICYSILDKIDDI